MNLRREHFSGRAYLDAATELLQRINAKDPFASIYEAADIQWWWREDDAGDAENQIFWSIDDGDLIAALVFYDDGKEWTCDLLRMPKMGRGTERQLFEEEFQRRGLGSALLSEGIRRLRAAGAEVLKVGYFESNEAARKLYHKLGFKDRFKVITYKRYQSEPDGVENADKPRP